MVNISICDRTSSKSSRLQVREINLGSNVSEFRCKTSKIIDVPVHELVLIYCGQALKDDRTLESYGLGDTSTVHVLKKTGGEEQEIRPEPMDAAAVQQVVTALQAALINPAHRNTVETMMSRPETLENLVAATPGLDKDPVALAMLQDPELLAILADPDNVHKVIEAHPCLGQAAMMVAAAINEEAAKTSTRTGSSVNRGTYSLDQMSDDDDDDVGPSVLRAPAQPITATQLAAALAMAGGGGASSQDSESPATSSSSSSGPPGGGAGSISDDFFRQAMMQAATPQQTATETNAALQQLRDMGITDETRARRALEVTGGNIQAALELLFGDNNI